MQAAAAGSGGLRRRSTAIFANFEMVFTCRFKSASKRCDETPAAFARFMQCGTKDADPPGRSSIGRRNFRKTRPPRYANARSGTSRITACGSSSRMACGQINSRCSTGHRSVARSFGDWENWSAPGSKKLPAGHNDRPTNNRPTNNLSAPPGDILLRNRTPEKIEAGWETIMRFFFDYRTNDRSLLDYRGMNSRASKVRWNTPKPSFRISATACPVTGLAGRSRYGTPEA